MAIARLFLGVWLVLCGSASAQVANWRETLGTFRIGLVAPQGSSGIEGVEEIRAAFSAAIGMPVEIFAARDYAVLVDAQATGRIHYAFHTATSYASISLLCSCVEPLAAPISADGSTGVRSVLVSRAEGPATADQASGHRLAIGPDDSVTGRLMPLAQFRPGGEDLTGKEANLVPVASETEAETRLATGDVDAMFGFAMSNADGAVVGGTLARLGGRGLVGARVIWTSDLLRNGPHAVRSNLPDEAKGALKAFLLGMQASNPRLYDLVVRQFSGGFAEVAHDDYAPALALVRKFATTTP